MTEQTASLRTRSRGPARHWDRTVVASASDDSELEQPPHRCETTVPDGLGAANQSKKSNTSIGVTAAKDKPRSEQNRKKLSTWNA